MLGRLIGRLKGWLERLAMTQVVRSALKRLDAWATARWPTGWRRATRALAVGTAGLAALVAAWPAITTAAADVVTALGGDPGKTRAYAAAVLGAVSAAYTALRWAFPAQPGPAPLPPPVRPAVSEQQFQAALRRFLHEEGKPFDEAFRLARKEVGLL